MTTSRLAPLIALISCATLLLELTIVRLLSVALWYPFAFVALGTALLGFGMAAVSLAISKYLQRLDAKLILRSAALFFAIASIGGYPLWNALHADPVSIAMAPKQIFLVALLLILITLPFIGAGLFMARAFALNSRSSPILYAADLSGGALGVVTYTLIFPLLGPGTLAFVAALAVLVVVLLATKRSRRFTWFCGFVFLAVVSLRLEHFIPLNISKNKILGARDFKTVRHWTVGSAIDILSANKERLLIIDGGTALSALVHLKPDTTLAPPQGLRALPYLLGPGHSTLIIGSGGGVEILAALGAGSQRILGLEIDHAINQIVRGPLTGALLQQPQVQILDAEARSYLAAVDEKFDAIVAFHTISNAASSTGGLALAENYLLTREGLQLILNHLSDDGVLIISRPEAQLGRLAATMATAWPTSYPPITACTIAVAASQEIPNFLSALVVRRQPFTQDDISRLKPYIGRLLYAPNGGGDSQAFLNNALSGLNNLATAIKLSYRPAVLTPTFDDRPFFNLLQPWSAISLNDIARVFGSGQSARARLEDIPMAQVAILTLLFLVLLLASPLVAIASLHLRRAQLSARSIATTFIYFSALGLAFMLLELGLVQSLTRLIGMPAHSLVAVLGALLAATGIGSFILAGKLQLNDKSTAAIAIIATIIVAFIVPAVVDVSAALSFSLRIVVTVSCVAITGFLLGGPFAAGLRELTDPRLVAIAWSANSMASVAGSVAALIISSAFGFATAALIAGGCYLIATLVAHLRLKN
ncbi:MAG: hypothetical protein JW841_02415 [Deltaproteobacteria bacterium]|nr:hypothetical protein [Deltaproteobacteria bacterium]